MNKNRKTSKSIDGRVRILWQKARARVSRRPWLSGALLACALLLVAAASLRTPALALVSRLVHRPTPTVAELRRATSTSTSAEQWRTLAHAELGAGHAMSSMKAYDGALKLDRAHVTEQMLVDIATLYYSAKLQPTAEELILRHKLVEVSPRLERLTDDGDHTVRWAAMGTLEKLGRVSKYDQRRALTADLRAPECDMRRKAVERLGALGDQRALPDLREAKQKDQASTPWYRTTCLGKRTDKAEKLILAKRT
jgi:hypothetical protein